MSPHHFDTGDNRWMGKGSEIKCVGNNDSGKAERVSLQQRFLGSFVDKKTPALFLWFLFLKSITTARAGNHALEETSDRFKLCLTSKHRPRERGQVLLRPGSMKMPRLFASWPRAHGDAADPRPGGGRGCAGRRGSSVHIHKILLAKALKASLPPGPSVTP